MEFRSAPILGGPGFSGFNDLAGVRDTFGVESILALGAGVHEPSCGIVWSARPTSFFQLPDLGLSRSRGMMILICYDGSADAQAAIDRAGLLMAGSEATVLVIWETVLETMIRHGSLGMGMVSANDDEAADAAIQRAATETAADGVRRATAAGLVARPRTVNRDDDIAAMILAQATELDADVIVLGTRGLGSVKSLLLGSVSHAVLHHADRAVLVIPSARLAERRQHWAEHGHVTADFT